MGTTSRRSFLKSLAALGAITVSSAGVLTLQGCPVTQTQLEQLINEVGEDLSGLLPYINGVSTDLASKIMAAFAALQSAIQTWVPGNAVVDIEQVVNDFVANMALIPIAGQYQPLVALIVATVEGIITLLVPSPSAPATNARLVAASKLAFPKPPRTAREFRSKWNAIAKAQHLSNVRIN